jgi:hypothetical protein
MIIERGSEPSAPLLRQDGDSEVEFAWVVVPRGLPIVPDACESTPRIEKEPGPTTLGIAMFVVVLDALRGDGILRLGGVQ